MTVAEVRLWGRTIGAVAMTPDDPSASFEYSEPFLASGIEVAPITMPLRRGVFRFPGLARETFHGLPGLLADSLPDRFGNALIDAWLAADGRDAASFDAVERLCYTGTRGIGALEFAPSLRGGAGEAQPVEIDRLVALASSVLTERRRLSGSFADAETSSEALQDILRVGTSAGGARAKAVIAWNRVTNEVRSGQASAPTGFEHWLLKFDGVSANADKELDDPQGFGAIEYAYSLDGARCRYRHDALPPVRGRGAPPLHDAALRQARATATRCTCSRCADWRTTTSISPARTCLRAGDARHPRSSACRWTHSNSSFAAWRSTSSRATRTITSRTSPS